MIAWAMLGLVPWLVHAASPLPPECPRRGTLEVVQDPAAWADQCFVALYTRLPQKGPVGESATEVRDIDLDGVGERLEIRGMGNASKSIYVFKVVGRDLVYLGEFGAHPSFAVALDAAGIPTITYVHRYGVDDLRLTRIQYRDGLFVEIGSEKYIAPTADGDAN